MRTWIIAVWTAGLTCLIAAPSSSQGVYVPEGPGHLTVGDFDADGVDDVLVLGMYSKSGFYKGSRRPPHHLTRMMGFGLADYWSLTDAPVYLGGYLYIPQSVRGGMAKIDIFDRKNGRWRLFRRVSIQPSQPGGLVNSLRITELHKDLDGDGHHDLLAVWGDVPMARGGAFHAAYISPGGAYTHIGLPRINGQTSQSTIVALHRAKPMVITQAPEYLVTLSASSSNGLGGFGFMILTDGPKVGAGLWAMGGPPLAYDKFVVGESPVAYGEFSIIPGMKTPLVHLVTGESILFTPWVIAPYVSKYGELLASSRGTLFLNQCVRDYDGDGIEEVVMLERYGTLRHTFMHVGDPTSFRRYSQFFDLQPTSSRYPIVVMHGAAGDFSGDGHPDLLLSGYTATPTGIQGYLSLYLANRSRGPGRPALRRAY